MKRILITITAAVALVLIGATFAFGGGRGMIWDDGHAAKPGSLDDGKELLPQTTLTLGQAIAAAQRAAHGQLGQVDLEQAGGRVVYMVDVGSQEVRIDANDGSVASIQPRD
jgi:uncharacterized membrane protein YkoI